MNLKSIVNNTTGLFGFKLVRTTPTAGNPLAVFGINKEDFEINGQNIFFKNFNVTLSKHHAGALLQGYANAQKLHKQKNATFTVSEKEELLITVDGITFCINDEEEFFILCEVFLEGSYNLKTPVNKKVSLIDIGMNVGITSLFYAGNPKVEKIFSFEPFTPTYNMALKNISLNPAIAQKIQPFNFGLAANEAVAEVSYSLQQKGRMGFNGLPQQSSVAKTDVSVQTIHLQSAAMHFALLKEKTADNFVVCKIDCEGAEYEIIDALDNASVLQIPDVYFIEWHYKSPETMIEKLLKNNFNVIGTTFSTMQSGMLYACKTNI